MPRRRLFVTLLMVVMSIARPALAAGDWGWPLGGGEVVLGYGSEYDSHTHSGIDIAGAAEEEVKACASGAVSFRGYVPAGSGGGRVLVVSVKTDDGLTVTYTPLSEAAVDAGSEVAKGETVGRLASGGDASSQVSHLHVGVRRGDTYIDPLSLMAAAQPRTDEPPAGVGPAAPPVKPAPVLRSDAPVSVTPRLTVGTPARAVRPKTVTVSPPRPVVSPSATAWRPAPLPPAARAPSAPLRDTLDQRSASPQRAAPQASFDIAAWTRSVTGLRAARRTGIRLTAGLIGIVCMASALLTARGSSARSLQEVPVRPRS